ncbi:MAG: DNA mismatch repair protein MutT [Paracoccus denitrificans]|nr:MAG: DNA mismatch repair protein MutT [Paracoccus denitrificans]PZO84158.1 MAG: DNA mismatch repair protein MutT [Paracoccus denitrificans]
MTDAAPIRDAASVVLIDRSTDDPKVLMGMRGAAAAFMPSKYVFPGGAVDADDEGLAADLAGLPDAANLERLCAYGREGRCGANAIVAAGVRELAEETGLLLGASGESSDRWPSYSEQGIAPDASALMFFFRAITPPGRPRRFDARFFLIDAAQVATSLTDFSRAEDELSHLHWVSLAEARHLDLPFITEVVLAEARRIVAASAGGPFRRPESVWFFDNEGEETALRKIA